MHHHGKARRTEVPACPHDAALPHRAPYAMPYRLLLLLLPVIFLLPERASAQYKRVSVAFYNVENLFDTLPDPFRNDRDFTPSGRYRWDTERYRRKLARIARTIDDAGFDVVALAETESETAVRDLVATLSDDYSFIHRSTSDSRGIDLALLYKGDKFFPDEISQIASRTSREFLFVRGELIGCETGILVCHMPSKFNDRAYRMRAADRLAEVADSLRFAAGCDRLIILGDLNGELQEAPLRHAFGPCRGGRVADGTLYDALYATRLNGFGSYCWNGRWLLYDNILVSETFLAGTGLHLEDAGVFVRRYLLTGDGSGTPYTEKRGYPFRTFSGARYLGGYSDHLPVFIILCR